MEYNHPFPKPDSYSGCDNCQRNWAGNRHREDFSMSRRYYDAAYRVYICKSPQELIALNLSECARIYVYGRRIIHTGYRGSSHRLSFGRLRWNRIATSGRFADAQDRKKKIKKSRDKRDFSNHLAAPI